MAREIAGTPTWALWTVAAAMVAGAALVTAYALAIRPNELAGDQEIFDTYGAYFTEGKLWWTTQPFGIPHASAVKAPGYPAWVGAWYELLGRSPLRLAIAQGLLLAPATVLLTALLARRLFGDVVAAASAVVVAALPLVWEFFGLVYSEALAIPFTVLVLLLFMGRPPTTRRAIVVGVAIGVLLLVRPTSVFLFAGVAGAWVVAAGWRRGLAMTALSVAVSALVLLPWTVRNHAVAEGFVPISLQDSAAYGTFNEESANDPVWPYAWRPGPENAVEILSTPVSEAELRSSLQREAFDHIADHPLSVLESLYWNGLSRFWDVRRPARAMDEVPFEGRSETATAIGLAMYYCLLPLALLGLWRMRARREIVVPVLAIAVGATLVFSVASGTRYRAPLEPLIVVMAVAGVFGGRLPQARRATAAPTA